MTTVFERLEALLSEAERASTMETMSIGFPQERIRVEVTHFPDERSGKVGDLVHPTEYIKRQTKLYRETWVLPPIAQARAILKANAELLALCDSLRTKLDDAGASRIHGLLRAGAESQRD